MGLFRRKKKQSKPMVNRKDVDIMLVNAVNDSIRARAMNADSMTGDTLHNVYSDFGYPEKTDVSMWKAMYCRSGIAGAIVELLVDQCWIDSPEILGTDQFNSDFEALAKRVKLFHRLKATDTRQRIGRYAAIFMRCRDGKNPVEPLEMLNGIGSIVDMMPLYENQLEVVDTVKDVMSDDYGKPSMYAMKLSDGGDIKIHPSRIIIASEGAEDGSIYGISVLERPYNALMDCIKIIGAGGEGFYKNAAQRIIFETVDGAAAKANKPLLDNLSENVTSFLKGFMRSMWVPGLKPTVLSSNLQNPKDFLMNALYDISASTKLPVTILIGQLTGRLASNEDGIRLSSMATSRRENFLNEFLGSVIDWFIKNGVLPASEYSIEWSDLMTKSDIDRLDIIEKMASTNEKQFRSGGELPFSGDDMRQAYGAEDELLPLADETLNGED